MGVRSRRRWEVPLLVSRTRPEYHGEQNDAGSSEMTHMGAHQTVFWKQPWGSPSATVLHQAVTSLGFTIKELSSQEWVAGKVAGIRDDLLSYFARAGDEWVALFPPRHFPGHKSLDADWLASTITKLQLNPVFLFVEVEQSGWGFELRQQAKGIALFWNRMEDNGELPQPECDISWVASVLQVPVPAIALYLQPIGWGEHPGKAFPDDEYDLDNHWVRVDFMRRVGIHYPSPGQGTGRYLLIDTDGSL
jgi:hypothetical protein